MYKDTVGHISYLFVEFSSSVDVGLDACLSSNIVPMYTAFKEGKHFETLNMKIYQCTCFTVD